jgi:hypothetical protein
VPLHPVVPNPYMLLAQIPPGTAYYSALDLKDAFFCTPLHPKSQPIFALKNPKKSLARSLGLSSPRDSQTAPISLGWL